MKKKKKDVLLWILQYRMKKEEMAHIKVFTDEVEAQETMIKYIKIWDYVQLTIHVKSV